MSFEIGNIGLLIAVMARVLSALMAAPVFSQRSVPAVSKIVLAGFLSWLLVETGGITSEQPSGSSQWLIGIGIEVFVGLLLGFVSGLAFWSLNMAGELIGQQMGWNFGGTLNATLDNSPTPTSQLYVVLGTLVFLLSNGLHLWLKALAETFTAVPPFSLTMGNLQLNSAISLISSLFAGAVQLALPVVGTLMFVEVLLAFISRALPRLNAWMLGLPLKIGVGLLALWLTLPVLLLLMQRWVTQAPGNMRVFLH